MKYAVAAFVLGVVYSTQWPENSHNFTREQIGLIFIFIGGTAAVGASWGLVARMLMRPQQAFPERVMAAVLALEVDQPEGMSAYEIGREIGAGGFGTLYATIRKLEADGVLVSWWSDESERRRLYRRVIR